MGTPFTTNIYFRLVNILLRTKLEKDKVWRIVKETRNSFLYEQTDPECQLDNTLIDDDDIIKNIDTMEAKFETTTSTSNIEMSRASLEFSAAAFTYLNFCPHKLLSFYNHLFKTGTPREIMLALTSIMKASQNAAKESSTKIFSEVKETLNLTTCEKIQILTNRKCYEDSSFGNCTMDVNEEDIKVLGFQL